MAGDWIKMRGNLWDDPRVSRIVDLTDTSEAAVVGGLYWLWATADQHTEDGCMPGLTLRQIDRKTGIPGFSAALVAIGWLRDDEQGVVIVDFEKHNGTSAKKRCQTAKRVANHAANNAQVTQDETETNAPSVSDALAREEKRREEIRDNHATHGGALPAEEPPGLALVPQKPKGPPDCPHVEVLALWAEVLPSMPQHLPSQWRGARADHLRARWRETAVEKGWTDQQQGLAFLRRLFGYIGQSKFLTGRCRPSDPSRSPFIAELEWIVNRANWDKLIEGKYHQEAE